ncbi:hypothetical protein [Neptunitalea lumnitzerae]|uniref:Uncharacterized protein n=1 Tax=Neptunitalea lumnitzerae TaxID=2965509 RepID=A0ABQ5MM96_9FLAO|nr:hypothetical protein [Neptunitalea sp. Y10]GLB50519.1 hypothetical protein Y10_28870 [Neptunitalea sp. Y10]
MKKLLVLFTIVTMLVSCNNDDDNGILNTAAGTWSGIYTGSGDNGTFTATVNSDGSLNGTAASDNLPDFEMNITGTVDADGNMTADLSALGIQIGNFTGLLLETEASGNWNTNYLDTSYSGTWTASKE